MTAHDHATSRPAPAAHDSNKDHRTGQRGSISLFVVAVIVVFFAVVGMVVDGGRKVTAQRHATAAAQGAARAGGQAVAGDTVAGIGAGAVDTAKAAAAARSYLAAAGVEGSVSVDNGELTVTATSTTSTLFVSLVGVDELHAAATAHARIAPGGP